ncbi:MAG: hypothetical protein SFV15_05005 [Polyangiaceae bacterium]|nr:hypothetical protein [Polyangiaceae bacterium]
MAAWQADVVRGKLEPGETIGLRWPALRVEVELKVARMIEGESLLLQNGELTTEFLFADDRLQVLVRGIEDDDAREGTFSSWELSLAMLEHYLTHHLDENRHATWFLRRSKTSSRIAHTFFTDSDALGVWLTRGTKGIGAVGSSYMLDLGGENLIEGRVLANVPERDILLSVGDTEQATLALRTFPSPYSDDERVIAMTWSRWGGGARSKRDEPVHALLEAAIDRLGGLLARAGNA